MASELEAVTFDVADPSVVATFWSELLRRDVVAEPDGSPGAG